MELKPAQLLALSIALFGIVVGVQVLMEYQSNEEFREKFRTRDFSALRPKLLQQEGIEEQEQEAQFVPEEDDEEG